MKRPQTSINTGLAAIFTLFYLQKSSYRFIIPAIYIKVNHNFCFFRQSAQKTGDSKILIFPAAS